RAGPPASKFVPFTVTTVPGSPCVGVKPVMVGGKTVVNALVVAGSALPARSRTPSRVTVYVVPGSRSAAGARNAYRPSAATVIVAGTAAVPMVSRALCGLMDDGTTGSEKRMATTALRSTPVALVAGANAAADGAAVSSAGGPINSVWAVGPLAVSPPATRISPEGSSVAL